MNGRREALDLARRAGLYDETASELKADCPLCRHQMKLEGSRWRCYGGCDGDAIAARLMASADGPADDSGVVTMPYSAIKREVWEWLWPGRIPYGAPTLLVGDPGLGKSMLTVQLAAEVSNAGHRAILVTAEDSPGATVRPRLELAGADLNRVENLEVRRDGVEDGLLLPDDGDALRTLMESKGDVRLLVVDPLNAHLPGSVNSWRDQSVRLALRPLARLAHDFGCAVAIVGHLNKGQGGIALHRTGGSIGVPGAVRSALLLARDPDDPDPDRGRRRVLAHFKCNIGPEQPTRQYELEPVDDTARLRYVGESQHNATDVLAASGSVEDRDALEDAQQFLLDELGEGPRPPKVVKAEARDAGHSERTLERAKSTLGIRSVKTGGTGAPWLWTLPDPAKAASSSSDASSDTAGDLSDSALESGAEARNGGIGPQRPPISDIGGLCPPAVDADLQLALGRGDSAEDVVRRNGGRP